MDNEDKNSKMKRHMKMMLIAMVIIFGIVFGIKAIFSAIGHYMMSHHENVVTVSTMKVEKTPWQPSVKAVANLRAINGVFVTAELSGMVQSVNVQPGAVVSKGTLIVQLNADAEKGQLVSLMAQLELAKITYLRDQAQYKVNAISKQTLDTSFENMKSLEGQVAQQEAIVLKKSVRAPFDGKLGLILVSVGQYINAGDKVSSLQSVDPIWVDFYVPQQTLVQMELNQIARVTSDSYPGKVFKGKITTIDSAVDSSTRNVAVEVTLANPQGLLRPGMFAWVEVETGLLKPHLTLPQTAISYNSYGNIVYIVEENKKEKDKKGNYKLFVKQAFVQTGDTRGDQVMVLKGIKEGDTIVTSGQLKLKNGSQVAINNSVVPPSSANPVVPDEH